MEIRQVLKSSASMIPDLFYKVSHETREMEKNRDSGGKGRKERRMSQRGGVKEETPQQSMEEDVARGGKTHTFGEEGSAVKVGRERE